MKKIYFILFLGVLLSAVRVNAQQVTVTATAGTPGPTNYTTLKGAFDAINAGMHQGDITVNINANTTETVQAVLNRTGTGGTVYTSVKISPTADGLTITGSITSAVIKLNNATNVTIDGDNPNTISTNRNLSVINTSATTPSIIWIGGSLGASANNIVLKNCILINGVNTSSGVVSSDATALGTAGYFTNITIQNNSIQKSFIGNYNIAVPTAGNGTGLLVTNNDLNTAGANSIRRIGIYVQGVDGATVSNNNISNIVDANAETPVGIWFATSTVNSTVSGNTLSSLSLTNTGNFGVYPINVTSGATSANITISGNSVSGITSAGTNIAGGILIGGINTSGVTVSNNTVSNISYTGASTGVVYGLYVATDNANANVNVTGNTITGITSGGVAINTGLVVGGATGGVTIQKNTISNIKNTSVFGANGIWLNSSLATSNINVYNNFIFDIAAYGFNGTGIADNGYGIAINSGGGYNLYYNTVLLNTNQTSASGRPSALSITGVVTSLNIRDNLFINTQTVGSDQYCVYSGVAAASYTNIDYNDYYTQYGPNLGFIGSNRVDLAAWRTGTGKDVNSISELPNFVSSTDLHLVTASNCNLHGKGTPITVPAITTDFDGDTRNATTPDMGADEITYSCPTGMVTVTATAGTPGPTPYPTVKAAFDAINAGTHQGAITVNINANTTESAQAVLNRNGAGAAVYTSVNIRPTVDGVVVSGNIASALIKFNNAANVTLDGDNPNTAGTNRNLSINNNNTSTASILWIGGSTGNVANNVTVKNCILNNGTTTSSNVVVSDATTIGTAGYFSNITIQNNSVQKSYIGIYSIAVPAAGNGNGLLISGNSFNSSGSDAINFGGVYVQGVDGATVKGNDIGNIENASAQNNFGVWFSTGTTNSTIENNIIHDIKYTGGGGFGGKGMVIVTGLSAANITAKNNMIYNITGDGFNYNTFGAYYCPVGIYAFGTGQGGLNIYFNSIWLNGGNTLNNNRAYSLGIALDNDVKANIKNNIILNQLGRAGGSNVGSACIAAQTSAIQFISLDYNVLLCNPTGSGSKNTGKIGGTDYTTLALWRTATGKETNSINTAPNFVSSTDLHLTIANIALKSGITIAGITTDIDNETRNATPTRGADELFLGNIWVGSSSTIWDATTQANWLDNAVPITGSDVTVLDNAVNKPVLTGISPTIGSLNLGLNNTLSLNGQTLTVGGAITTGVGSSFTGSSTSNLVLNAAAGTLSFTQTTPATRSLNNLTLGTSGTATLGTALDVYGNVQVINTAANAMNFNTQNVTLKSDVNNTASIDKLNTTGTNLINATNVTVERWIPLRSTNGLLSGSGNNGRAYRVLTSTVNTTPSTINANWQEGLTNTVIGTYNVPASPYQNFGTHITGAGGSANGFDITQTNESSLYTFTNGSNINSTLGYPAVANTNVLTLAGTKGYFMYIRGDRNVSTQLPYQPAGGMPTSSTTLRAKGSVLKGSVAYTISGTTGDFSLITNPYPAPIDWDAVSTANTNISTFYTLWDPNQGIRGGFSTVPKLSSTHRYIQPGEGFFVQKVAGGTTTVTITEAMKAVGNNNNTVFFTDQTPYESFRAQLYLTEATNNIRHTADEVLVRYDNNYSQAVDWDDAEEINNWNENIAISRGGTRLAIESRPVITNRDTIPLFMNNMRKTNYEFEFTPSLFTNTGLIAELVDNYLNTRTLLSVTSTVTVPFTVNNDAASSATDRFMVVFGSPSGPLPIDLSSVKAYEKNAGIQVDWVMNTEQDMDKYEVEKSADGRNFAKATTVASRGNSSIQVNYGWFDANPIFGDNFYRIKSIDKSGQYKNSNIVRVNLGKGGGTDISMYPNPFEGTGFNLQMDKLAAGKYTMTMYNNLGQRVYSGTVTHGGGSATQYIELGKDLASGTYTVKISGGGTELTRTITKK